MRRSGRASRSREANLEGALYGNLQLPMSEYITAARKIRHLRNQIIRAEIEPKDLVEEVKLARLPDPHGMQLPDDVVARKLGEIENRAEDAIYGRDPAATNSLLHMVADYVTAGRPLSIVAGSLAASAVLARTREESEQDLEDLRKLTSAFFGPTVAKEHFTEVLDRSKGPQHSLGALIRKSAGFKKLFHTKSLRDDAEAIGRNLQAIYATVEAPQLAAEKSRDRYFHLRTPALSADPRDQNSLFRQALSGEMFTKLGYWNMRPRDHDGDWLLDQETVIMAVESNSKPGEQFEMYPAVAPPPDYLDRTVAWVKKKLHGVEEGARRPAREWQSAVSRGRLQPAMSRGRLQPALALGYPQAARFDASRNGPVATQNDFVETNDVETNDVGTNDWVPPDHDQKFARPEPVYDEPRLEPAAFDEPVYEEPARQEPRRAPTASARRARRARSPEVGVIDFPSVEILESSCIDAVEAALARGDYEGAYMATKEAYPDGPASLSDRRAERMVVEGLAAKGYQAAKASGDPDRIADMAAEIELLDARGCSRAIRGLRGEIRQLHDAMGI